MQPQKMFLLLMLVAVGFLSTRCGKPTFTAMTPTSGGPHTLVEVDGDVTLAGTYWDAGTASEQRLPTGVFAGTPFSVPAGATTGNHDVRVRRNGEWSDDTRSFNVTNPALMPFPNPKINYIQLYAYDQFDADSASFLLFVQGPNIDVSADMQIGGVTQETYFWQGLRNNLNGVDPRTLAYPIYHYGMVFCSIRATVGDNLSIRVRNEGGGLSNTLTFTVPPLDELDSDGDSLLDDWEENGYDADGDGTVDVDLPAMGANPYHFDIFAEVDWMNGRAPTAAAWPIVEQSFADAPLLNVLYGSGIHIHIDRGQSTFTDYDGNVQTIPAGERKGGQTLAFSDFIRMDSLASPLADPGETTVNFYDLKSSNFDSDRADVFRYGIFAQFHGHSNCSSGRGEIWGNDLMITRTCNSDYFSNANNLAGTFLHEFGHNLNFRHGGGSDGDNTNNEPNYLSIMNYLFQFPGVDNNCDQTPDGIFTYSQGMHNNLNENNLNESNGICGSIAIDWNSNGSSTQTGLSFDINGDGSFTTLTDFDNWGNLFFNFRDAPDFND